MSVPGIGLALDPDDPSCAKGATLNISGAIPRPNPHAQRQSHVRLRPSRPTSADRGPAAGRADGCGGQGGGAWLCNVGGRAKLRIRRHDPLAHRDDRAALHYRYWAQDYSDYHYLARRRCAFRAAGLDGRSRQGRKPGRGRRCDDLGGASPRRYAVRSHPTGRDPGWPIGATDCATCSATACEGFGRQCCRSGQAQGRSEDGRRPGGCRPERRSAAATASDAWRGDGDCCCARSVHAVG